MTLPDLGVGLVHLPGLGPLLDELSTPPDVVEIEPQAFWSHKGGAGDFQVNPALLEQAAGPGPVLVHSVGFPIGGISDGDTRQVVALRETFACLKPAWWSEHASFVWAGAEGEQRHLGFLMPPVQSAESVGVIADRIKQLQDLFGLPFAFETGVNYFQPLPGELPDGEFWAAIADRGDCGILLDLHNIWTNAANGREPLKRIVAELPLERVWEIHMAGGQSHNGYWLDSHSGLPPSDLVKIADEIVPRIPHLHAIILEIIPDYIPVNDIAAADVSACLNQIRDIWRQRGTRCSDGRSRPIDELRQVNAQTPSMQDWERYIEQALCPAGPKGYLQKDGGSSIYRDLIAVARRGMVVESLPLTLRYLLKSRGEGGVDDLFRRFWAAAPVQPFISDEARAFADFIRREVSLAHLGEVLDFELAAHEASITGQALEVPFTCDPEALFRSLMAGAPQAEIRPCEVTVEVAPPLHE